ncbi:putative elongator complex protein 1 [Neocloeon triangulifer]|uniref:putative elongator complex protein 1 n=1 Tax=Neocloeon triangulifer TaxID=2078957 RepID=UPI00286F607B|nr:putative elongator complex protein 1 [Neocloeon triangulifer]
MKNLRLRLVRAFESPELPSSPWFCVKSDGGAPVLFLLHGKTIFKVDLNSDKVIGKYELDVPEDSVQVVGIRYTSVWEKLFVALAVGEVAALENDEISFVGSVESGIKAMEWSPDESLVVLVTGVDKLMILSADFDQVGEEVELNQDGFGEKQFVNVGWGKKETQFHGSEGKAAAQTKVVVEEKAASDMDDRAPRIKWRGDGALFAVSYLKNTTGARQIRMFNREGILQFTSEPTVGLEQSLDWKLSGGVIASTITLPNKQVVAFFEKNGLRHGDFTLPFQPNQVIIKELSWNLDSTILAIWCFFRDSGKSCLQLWASSNYNWQLKQNLNFPAEKRLLNFSWDKELIYNLHVVQEGPVYVEYVWKWEVDHSCGFEPSDLASVAVIDGGNVKMTNLREAVVPPPMCSYSLKLQNSVSCVAFSQLTDSSNDICIVTCENKLAVFTLNGPDFKSESLSVALTDDGLGFSESGSKLRVSGYYQLDWNENPLKFGNIPCSFHHWLWISSSELVCVAPAGKSSSVLLKAQLQNDLAKIISAVNAPGLVKGVSFLPGIGVVVNVESESLKLWNLESNTLDEFSTNTQIQFKNFYSCVQFNIVQVESETHVIGRSLLGQLYVDSVDVMKNCSSYFIHSDFILITTSENKLLCIPRTKNGIESLLKRSKLGIDGTERQIEHGAVLVAAVANDTRVVLQMPRGNLEAVQPRALAIFIVKKLLDNKKYFEAFDIMRKQRINLNLIYDHNPALFLGNIKEFVQQIKNQNWLCLFLADLMEMDVTESMYAGHYPNKREFALPANSTKLDFICTKMRENLVEVDKDGLVLPVITTFIKETSSNIGAALQCINKIKMEEQSGKKLPVSSDEALNYLFYIVDVYELFDVALGLYDFELVMLVAQKSQKDPKEYIPFLNELRKLEPAYRKFTIDKHLKKYEAALTHLKDCGPEHDDECRKFILDHKLHSAALKTFNTSHRLYQGICQEYGSQLVSEQLYEEAGIIFQRALSLTEAVDAFKKAGCWRRIMPILPNLGWSESKLALFYEELAHDLRERKQYLDSALVFGDYVKKPEERLISLCKAKAWDEACRIKSSADIQGADELLRFEIMNHHSCMLSDVETAQEQVTQYTNRLVVVRSEKAKKIEEGDDFANLPECDMFSDTSSIRGSTQSRSSGMSSRGTGRTYRSSKNKRKHERKLLSLKEGSPYEDLALVRALHELFTKIYTYREEVKCLCVALLQLNVDSLAVQLQSKLSALLKDMESKKNVIWIPELAQNRAAALAALGPEGTSNSLSALSQINPLALTAAAELDPHLCLPPLMPHSSWNLKILL